MPSNLQIMKIPRTQVVRDAMQTAGNTGAAEDLLFLEAWEIEPSGDLGATLRASQIRRANPGLSAEINRELKRRA
jgi:hypothetical protein